METQEKTQEKVKDIVVVARNGYQVLLNVGPHNLTIDCYTPVNLSELFPEEQLQKSSSLRAHLSQGNLIFYSDGQELPKNLHEISIKPMREVEETKIETTYKQSQQTAAAHVRIETTNDIDDDFRETLQEKVAANRETILNTDKKILDKSAAKDNVVSTSDIGTPLSQRGEMSASELRRTVTMDIDPADFKARQMAARKRLQEQDKADDIRIRNEIAEIEEAEQDLT
jgi:hypothetical protein